MKQKSRNNNKELDGKYNLPAMHDEFMAHAYDLCVT
jgi:hypothetical protein